MEKIIVLKERLSITEFLALTEMIAEGYFDVNNEYQPHWGYLSSLRLFYIFGIESSKYDEEIDKNFKSLVGDEMEKLTSDKDFLNAYETAICAGCNNSLSFGAAYQKAMDIVNTKKSSIGTAISVITGAIKDMSEGVKTYMTKENLSYLSTIAKEIQSGKLSSDSVVESYLKKTNNKG